MKHAFKNGLSPLTLTIDHNNKAIAVTRKLSFKDAEEIRTLYKSGQYSQSKLSKKYNVSPRTIFDIVHNQRYRKESY